MERVTRQVTDPFELSAISKFNRKMEENPGAPRLCPTHGEAVSLSFVNFKENPGPTPPFEAVFSGCCEAAIQRELEFINRTLAE